MKRRKFLSLIGAATTAPLMPMPALGAATAAKATYTPAAIHGAILHAQSSRYVSAWGLSRVLNVPIESADDVMAELLRRRVIAPINGSRKASRWAASRVHNPVFARAPRKAVRKTSRDPSERVDHAAEPQQPNIDLLMAHLREMSRRYFAAQPALQHGGTA